MVASAISIPLKIAGALSKKSLKKGAKKLTKKERALKAAEAEARYEQGLGLFEVPIAGLKKGGAVHTMPDGTIMKGAKHGMKHGGMVIKDRQYLKGK